MRMIDDELEAELENMICDVACQVAEAYLHSMMSRMHIHCYRARLNGAEPEDARRICADATGSSMAITKKYLDDLAEKALAEELGIG